MSPAPTPQRPSQTKIVATIGPATDSEEQLAELIAAGVDVFRLNMAHGNRAEHERVLDAIRSAARGMDRIVGVLVDLAGPKIRLGELPEGKITCDDGAVFRFVRGDESREPGQLVTTYERLVDELTVGDRVVLADGSVTLTVTEAGDDYAECRVVQSGEIRSRQGVNLPGVKLSVPALGPADLDNAAWAAGAGIDFVGLSFVRAAEEIRQLKAHLASHTPDDADSTAQVIAKIEKPEALEN
ncbi:MAG: IMP dehydrogenase, partial [Planctomycetes bacterium]|nr:IMP dehydrogenase [Planctomycetota bacterium]